MATVTEIKMAFEKASKNMQARNVLLHKLLTCAYRYIKENSKDLQCLNSRFKQLESQSSESLSGKETQGHKLLRDVAEDASPSTPHRSTVLVPETHPSCNASICMEGDNQYEETGVACISDSLISTPGTTPAAVALHGAQPAHRPEGLHSASEHDAEIDASVPMLTPFKLIDSDSASDETSNRESDDDVFNLGPRLKKLKQHYGLPSRAILAADDQNAATSGSNKDSKSTCSAAEYHRSYPMDDGLGNAYSEFTFDIPDSGRVISHDVKDAVEPGLFLSQSAATDDFQDHVGKVQQRLASISGRKRNPTSKIDYSAFFSLPDNDIANVMPHEHIPDTSASSERLPYEALLSELSDSHSAANSKQQLHDDFLAAHNISSVCDHSVAPKLSSDIAAAAAAMHNGGSADVSDDVTPGLWLSRSKRRHLHKQSRLDNFFGKKSSPFNSHARACSSKLSKLKKSSMKLVGYDVKENIAPATHYNYVRNEKATGGVSNALAIYHASKIGAKNNVDGKIFDPDETVLGSPAIDTALPAKEKQLLVKCEPNLLYYGDVSDAGSAASQAAPDVNLCQTASEKMCEKPAVSHKLDKFPAQTAGQPNYAYSEVVRGKKRLNLKGYSCRQCAEYFSTINLPVEEQSRRMNAVCRHRAQRKPPQTPTGFWDMQLDYTEPDHQV